MHDWKEPKRPLGKLIRLRWSGSSGKRSCTGWLRGPFWFHMLSRNWSLKTRLWNGYPGFLCINGHKSFRLDGNYQFIGGDSQFRFCFTQFETDCLLLFCVKAPEFLCKLNGPNNGAGNFKLNVRIIGLESSTRKGSRKLNIFNYTGQQNFGLEDPF